MIDLYDGEIAYADSLVAQLLFLGLALTASVGLLKSVLGRSDEDFAFEDRSKMARRWDAKMGIYFCADPYDSSAVDAEMVERLKALGYVN